MSGQIKGRIWSSEGAHSQRQLTRLAIYGLLATVVIVLGLNWPVMATGIRSITPMWMGVFRIGGAFLAVVAIVVGSSRVRLPPRHDVPMILSMAVFRLTAVSVLVFTALELVPPGRSSVVVWTQSLWTVPIAALFLGEHMTGRRWVGLSLGILGVLVLFEPWKLDWTDSDVAVGHALLLLAALANAGTAVHIRGHRWTMTPLQALPWQLLCAVIILLTLAITVEGAPVIDWTPQLVWIVIYQGVLATGVAFWAQVTVLRNMSAVSTNLSLMAVPVVGVVSSALLLGEQVTIALTLGLILVVAGVTVNLLSDRDQPDLGPPVVD